MAAQQSLPSVYILGFLEEGGVPYAKDKAPPPDALGVYYVTK